jgi:hypothetical protein
MHDNRIKSSELEADNPQLEEVESWLALMSDFNRLCKGEITELRIKNINISDFAEEMKPGFLEFFKKALASKYLQSLIIEHDSNEELTEIINEQWEALSENLTIFYVPKGSKIEAYELKDASYFQSLKITWTEYLNEFNSIIKGELTKLCINFNRKGMSKLASATKELFLELFKATLDSGNLRILLIEHGTNEELTEIIDNNWQELSKKCIICYLSKNSTKAANKVKSQVSTIDKPNELENTKAVPKPKSPVNSQNNQYPICFSSEFPSRSTSISQLSSISNQGQYPQWQTANYKQGIVDREDSMSLDNSHLPSLEDIDDQGEAPQPSAANYDIPQQSVEKQAQLMQNYPGSAFVPYEQAKKRKSSTIDSDKQSPAASNLPQQSVEKQAQLIPAQAGSAASPYVLGADKQSTKRRRLPEECSHSDLSGSSAAIYGLFRPASNPTQQYIPIQPKPSSQQLPPIRSQFPQIAPSPLGNANTNFSPQFSPQFWMLPGSSTSPSRGEYYPHSTLERQTEATTLNTNASNNSIPHLQTHFP